LVRIVIYLNFLGWNIKKISFIIFALGQAGRGNNEEFGLLSLEYDENFCMGGPGIIMSRQTLKRGMNFVCVYLKWEIYEVKII
jgi:hypothetical protein